MKLKTLETIASMLIGLSIGIFIGWFIGRLFK